MHQFMSMSLCVTKAVHDSYVSGDLIAEPEACLLMMPTIIAAAVAGWPAVTH